MKNNSPWIHQLNKERKVKKLDRDISTDVAIVGAGIAGISTAFYLLKYTNKKVVVVEGYKLAHGATGHNAGQIAAYFERPFSDVVREFGLDMACDGQRIFDTAWELLNEMYTTAGLDIPLFRFKGYSGHSTKEQVLGRLENDYLRRKGGLYTDAVEIFEEIDFLHEIPEKYANLFNLVSREQIALRLETFDPQYIAVSASQKGVMNSALFCQEAVSYILGKYKERFSLHEFTPIGKVVMHKNRVILDAEKHTIECGKAVLCTNGFENFDIITPDGLSLNTRFHHNLNGLVAFMSGYLEPYTGVPAAISYFQKEKLGLTDDPNAAEYFYVTRRPYEYEKELKHNLISVGGPDFTLTKKTEYNRDMDFSEMARSQIAEFIHKTYDKNKDMKYAYSWHGIMGYTNNLLRMIGPDPSFPHLYYNLGCNGVGILPSIFGGNKVARQIAGEKFSPSIFDVSLVDQAQKERRSAQALS